MQEEKKEALHIRDHYVKWRNGGGKEKAGLLFNTLLDTCVNVLAVTK